MPAIQKNIANGYILAGGKSSRMGSDKGLMQLKGKAVILHVIEQLQMAVNKVTIVSNNPEYKKFGFEVIGDLVKDIGPAGGIYSALNHSTVDKNFVVSCDMPLITSRAVKFFIEKSTQNEITLPMYKQKLEPLFGVYSKTCLFKWKELIDKKTVKLQELVEYFNVWKLNVDENELFDDKTFMNLNTKEDIEEVQKQR